jgi:hypothetical protein
MIHCSLHLRLKIGFSFEANADQLIVNMLELSAITLPKRCPNKKSQRRVEITNTLGVTIARFRLQIGCVHKKLIWVD